MWSWLTSTWNKFETWVHSFLPGWKTQITNFLGIVGSGAAVFQEYVTQAPLTQFVEAKTLGMVSLALFTLSFWFKGMGDRVNASIPQPTP